MGNTLVPQCDWLVEVLNQARRVLYPYSEVSTASSMGGRQRGDVSVSAPLEVTSLELHLVDSPTVMF